MQYDALLEALLFYTGERMDVADATTLLACTPEEVREAATMLAARLTGGITLVHEGDSMQLTTATSASDLIAQMRQRELSRDLGKAATETLAIITYRGPIAKSRIDVIRGVNSSAILRSLLVRGLIERMSDAEGRGYLYGPSLELLQYLGITNTRELPDFDDANTRIENYLAAEEPNDHE